MALTYEVVPDEIRERVERIKRYRTNPLADALESGQTLFVEGADNSKASLYETARNRGFQMHMRKFVMDKDTNGKNAQREGHVIWWDKQEEEAE